MDLFTVLIVVAIVASVAAPFLRYRAWSGLQEKFGLAGDKTRLHGTVGTIQMTIERMSVTVDLGPQLDRNGPGSDATSKTTRYTRWTLRHPRLPSGISVARGRSSTVETGDPEMANVEIHGDAVAALAALTPPNREALAHLCALAETRLSEGELKCSWRRHAFISSELIAQTERLVSVAEMFEAPPDDLEAALLQRATTDPVEGVRRVAADLLIRERPDSDAARQLIELQARSVPGALALADASDNVGQLSPASAAGELPEGDTMATAK